MIIIITGSATLLLVTGLIALIIVAAVRYKKDMNKVVKHRHPDNIRRKYGETADTGTIPSSDKIDAFLRGEAPNAEKYLETNKVLDLIEDSTLSPKEKLLLTAHTVRDIEEGLIS